MRNFVGHLIYGMVIVLCILSIKYQPFTQLLIPLVLGIVREIDQAINNPETDKSKCIVLADRISDVLQVSLLPTLFLWWVLKGDL